MKKLIVSALACLFILSIYVPSLSYARGGVGRGANGNNIFREQNTYRYKENSTYKNRHRNQERETKGKEKGKLNRATPATPAQKANPTPGIPGATKAVPAIPAVPAKK